MKRFLTMAAVTILTLCGTISALGQTSYDYIERSWDADSKEVKTETKTCSSYTAINGSDTSDEGWVGLYAGWYVVTGNSAYKVLNVLGTDVHLVLPDGMTLNVTHIKLEEGHKLTIHGQSGDTGKLVANNASGIDDAAGIGGGDEARGGVLVIQGGIVEATGNTYGAGIGGGDKRGFAQSPSQGGLFVYGGSVTAHGGQYGAGIGSGDENVDGTAGYVIIYGGTVNATGGDEGAGIGGGNDGHGAMFSIYGGVVTATGGSLGAGIGGGDAGHTATTTFYGGTVMAKGGHRGAGIGGGEGGYATAVEVRGGSITAEGGDGGTGIGGGYGEAGDCRGIFFYDGTVEAKGLDGAAGIGGGHESNYCELTISGGTITAYSAGKGPGIGRGMAYNAQNSEKKTLVTITGGDVTAWSSDGGAGIGTGVSTTFNGKINISGGKVTATGNAGGAGIGTGSMTDNYHDSPMYGWIIISGGTINATGKRGGAGIGSGTGNEIKEEALIQILGGDVTAYAESGGAIGAGGTKWADTGDGYHFSKSNCNCPIQINGDNITLHLTPNPAKDYTGTNSDKPCGAIHFGDNSSGSLSVSGKLAVTAYGTTYPVSYRISTLQKPTEVYVAPCSHSNTYTRIDDSKHTVTCQWCGHSEEESHATEGVCPCLSTVVTLANNSDNSTTISTNDGNQAYVTLSGRTLLKDGSWNTLCLPFDVTIAGSVLDGDNVEAKVFDNTSSLSDAGVLTLKFSAAPATITAGTPFIVKWDNTGVNLENPVFTGVTISSTAAREVVSTDTNVKFVGQYSPFSITSDNINEILYVASGNKIGYSAGTRTLKSCRAHFWVKPNGEAAAARAIKIDWGDGEQTGITTTNYTNLTNSDGWFTLDGRKLSGLPTTKGVYIVNGRKIVVK